MAKIDENHWARVMLKHQRQGIAMERITDQVPELAVADGYRIQAALIQLRLQDGERLIGWKMGLTSEAKQRSVGVSLPIFGALTDAMELSENQLPLDGLIHPRVEPELALVLNRPLPETNLTFRDILSATECVLPAVEVIDSRFAGFSFTAADVVADNASAAKFYVSPNAYTPYNQDWSSVGVTVYKNGMVQQTGAAAAVLGHPLRAVSLLARMLAEEGLSLEPGMVILTGGITEAVPVTANDHLTVTFDGLGTLDFHVVGRAKQEE